MDLLQEASTLLKERAALTAKLREKDDQIRQFCRKYEAAIVYFEAADGFGDLYHRRARLVGQGASSPR